MSRRRRHRRRNRRGSTSNWVIGAQLLMMLAVLVVLLLFRDWAATSAAKTVNTVAGEKGQQTAPMPGEKDGGDGSGTTADPGSNPGQPGK